jgi:hypothetical protein
VNFVGLTLFRQVPAYPHVFTTRCELCIYNLLGYKLVSSASNPNLRKGLDEKNVKILPPVRLNVLGSSAK